MAWPKVLCDSIYFYECLKEHCSQRIEIPEVLYEDVVEVQERVILQQDKCELGLPSPELTGSTNEKVCFFYQLTCVPYLANQCCSIFLAVSCIHQMDQFWNSVQVVPNGNRNVCPPSCWSKQDKGSHLPHTASLCNAYYSQLHLLTPLDETKLRKDLSKILAKGIRSLAVALMHSYTWVSPTSVVEKRKIRFFLLGLINSLELFSLFTTTIMFFWHNARI